MHKVLGHPPPWDLEQETARDQKALSLEIKNIWKIHRKTQTCAHEVARLVHPPNEKLQADDGVDYDDKHDQHTNVEQGHHGFHDGVQHNL